MLNISPVLIRFLPNYRYNFSKFKFGRLIRYPKIVNVTHNMTIEVIWTLIPALILIIIALPSFSLLYSADEVADPVMTIKVIGNQ